MLRKQPDPFWNSWLLPQRDAPHALTNFRCVRDAMRRNAMHRCEPALWRMLEDVPMELLIQQGLCLPGCMQMHIVMQQNNSMWELASSARNLRSHQPAGIKQHTSQSAGFSIGTAMATAISALTTDKVWRKSAWDNFQHDTEYQKPMIGCNKAGAWTVYANVPG